MVTEIVVKEALSSEMISAGADLTRRLDEANFIVTASFWFYISDANAWRLMIANPSVGLDGPRKAYKQIQSVISRMPDDQPKIELKDITVIDSKKPLISTLRRITRVEGISGIRFSGNVIDGTFIEDVYIYRIT